MGRWIAPNVKRPTIDLIPWIVMDIGGFLVLPSDYLQAPLLNALDRINVLFGQSVCRGTSQDRGPRRPVLPSPILNHTTTHDVGTRVASSPYRMARSSASTFAFILMPVLLEVVSEIRGPYDRAEDAEIPNIK